MQIPPHSPAYPAPAAHDAKRKALFFSTGAVNIMDGDFVLVCLGRDVMRCDLSEVRVGELMNLSGITVKGIDKGTGKEMSVIAYFADKF